MITAMQNGQDRSNPSTSLRPLDTSEDAARVQIRILRKLGLEGRAAMTFELCENLRRLVRDGLRDRHPDWDEAMVERHALRLMLGQELYREAFGRSESAQ